MNTQEIKQFMGNKLKYFRLNNNLTQLELANKLGIKHSTVSAYEKGKVTMDSITVLEICRLFDIEITDLFPNKTNNIIEKERKSMKYEIIFKASLTDKIIVEGGSKDEVKENFLNCEYDDNYRDYDVEIIDVVEIKD